MSSRSELRLVRWAGPVEDPLLLERGEDYFDHLCGPLVGVVPFRERAAWREEVRFHLDALIEELCRDMTEAEATEQALREFGEPWQIGQVFTEEWSRRTPAGPVARLAGTASLYPFAW